MVKEHFEKVNLVSAENNCVQNFGKSVYASAYLLGVCYQRGFLPFNLKQMRQAIESSIKKIEVKNNLAAFELGRLSVFAPEKLPNLKSESNKVQSLKNSIKSSFLPWQSTQVILKTFDRYLKRLKEYFPSMSCYYLGQFLHDQIIFDRGRNIDGFVRQAGALSQRA